MVFDANLSPTTKATSGHYFVLQTPFETKRAEECSAKRHVRRTLKKKEVTITASPFISLNERRREPYSSAAEHPAPRSSISPDERSKMLTRQPAARRQTPEQSPPREPPMTRARGLLLSGLMAATRSHSVRNRRPSRYCALFQNRQCVQKRGKSLPEMLRVVAPRKTRPAD